VFSLALHPDGRREPGVRVAGVIVRREWHQLHRERDGYGEISGEWVSDTVARCRLVTAAEPVECRFTPKSGGTYVVTFRATDPAGREAVTSFVRWTTGKDWVPWNDESQFKMDVIPDRARYAVGDTATVLFASPFTDAEAWITIEREGLLQQRRQRITSGTTTLKLPITEALAPNAFVSIIVSRGRTAAPLRADDPGRPTIRVGYAELRITPEVIQAGGAAHARVVADQVMKNAGGTVLVVGHSNTIPAIVGALGAPQPKELCDSEYDQLFVVAAPGVEPVDGVRRRPPSPQLGRRLEVDHPAHA
jgi:hypothetical protein